MRPPPPHRHEQVLALWSVLVASRLESVSEFPAKSVTSLQIEAPETWLACSHCGLCSREPGLWGFAEGRCVHPRGFRAQVLALSLSGACTVGFRSRRSRVTGTRQEPGGWGFRGWAFSYERGTPCELGWVMCCYRVTSLIRNRPAKVLGESLGHSKNLVVGVWSSGVRVLDSEEGSCRRLIDFGITRF